MPQEKKKKTACPVFFTVQVAFPFLCKILSLYLCVCLNGGRKVWEKEAENVRNRNLVRASECWRQKRSARPGTALCYTQDPAPSFHSGNKHSSLSLSKKDFVFFFFSLFLILKFLTSLKKKERKRSLECFSDRFLPQHLTLVENSCGIFLFRTK